MEKIQALEKLKDRLDPFSLAQAIEKKLERISKLANSRQSTKSQESPKPLSKAEEETVIAFSRIFPGLSVQTKSPDKKRRR
jgi:hypothetical protein